MKNNIKMYRVSFGLSQQELAVKLKSHRPLVCLKENGKREIKHREMLEILKIFREYDPNITLDQIFLPRELALR